MQNALIVFVNIVVMLIYALPGFILVKTKMLKIESISGFNTILLYVAQPCLVYYSFTKVKFESRILLNMLYAFLISLIIMCIVIGIFFLITNKKQKESVTARIMNIALAFGNCTFIGVPLLEALLPSYPEAAMYSVVFFLSMSFLGWTVACTIISRDKKYISFKKIVLNPGTIGLIVCLPFFLLNAKLPDPFHGAINLMGRMSTPLCMIILGMRLGALPLKTVVLDPWKYLVVAFRQLLVPLIYVLICFLLPLEVNLKVTLIVCGSTPVAAMVLNYAELMNEGQDFAAGTIILSNVLATLTMPLIILLTHVIFGI